MKLNEENRTNKIDKADHTRVTFFQIVWKKSQRMIELQLKFTAIIYLIISKEIWLKPIA